MRAWIPWVALGLGLVAVAAWLALRAPAASPAVAAPDATRVEPLVERGEAQERAALAVPEPPPAGAPALEPEGREDAPAADDDALVARKYAGLGTAELEAALAAATERWHVARSQALDAAFDGGNFATYDVEPAQLDATLRELSDAARRDGAVFASRTVRHTGRPKLELRFVRLERAAWPALFAEGDEVRRIERVLERTRREDDER